MNVNENVVFFLCSLYIEISLPSSHQHERDDIRAIDENSHSNKTMHIGGFNFLQQNKTVDSGSAVAEIVEAAGILKEFNKNTATDNNSKVNKKYKFGHINKSFEPSSAYGNCESHMDIKFFNC